MSAVLIKLTSFRISFSKLIVVFFRTDELAIDFQFTFNLSKKEDRHFRQINFKNSPPKAEIDADFNILCSVPAKMNITKKTGKIFVHNV